jgi:hypothetical protein
MSNTVRRTHCHHIEVSVPVIRPGPAAYRRRELKINQDQQEVAEEVEEVLVDLPISGAIRRLDPAPEAPGVKAPGVSPAYILHALQSPPAAFYER